MDNFRSRAQYGFNGEEKFKSKALVEMATCGKCGLKLAWKKLPNGRWFPTNPDGSDHWDVCSNTRAAKAKQDRLEQRDSAPGTTQKAWGNQDSLFNDETGVAPKRFVEICSMRCAVPAWEQCKNCPEGLGNFDAN